MIGWFWQPPLVRRRRYTILVRPTKQGEFLVFPYGHDKGGPGWCFSRTAKNRLEAPDWHIYDGLFLSAGLSCFMLAFVAGWPLLILMMLTLAGWQYYVSWRFQKRLQDLASVGRAAPVRLIKRRYDLEYAAQLPYREIMAFMSFGYGSGALMLAFMFWLFSQDAYQPVAPLMIIPLAGLVFWVRLLHKRLADAMQARELEIVPGEPADIPLPDAPSQQQSQEAAEAPETQS